ncbi:MAG: c-type cytochrome [Acidobacteriota bacterium]|nr:c-type cytochrome [Acidobacteriota bacterium]
MMQVSALLFFAAAAAQAATVAADSDRGAKLFETLHCVECHSINGKGGTAGPDLSRRIDRNFTPASLAATIWNHAPTMWTAMRARNIEIGDLNEQAAADLFAYFYSARFFDKPGDAGRGKRLFSAKHCAECHGLTETKLPEAKPVAQWESIGHPIVMVSAMWNHGVNMRQQFARRKLAWPELTSQDLTDLLVYLRNLPSTRNTPVRFAITSGANGQALFTSKGCAKCHTGNLALPARLKNKTLTDIAVAMWNHEPMMAPLPPTLDVEEMREIVSYLWAQEFFEDSGRVASGERVFTTKHCAKCHNDASSGAPKLTGTGRSFSGTAMVAALWHHGPNMLERMKAQGIAWPRFDAQEMSSLIGYLNAKKVKE